MNAYMYVCISMVVCCFMLASTVHNLDCYFTSVYLWLCTLFLLIVNLLLILGFILIVCVFSAFFLLSVLFFFFFFSPVLFYLYTVLGYVLVCNFPCVHLTFTVLLHAFWWGLLCLILFSVYFTSSSPYHPVLFFVCLFVCLFVFFS